MTTKPRTLEVAQVDANGSPQPSLVTPANLLTFSRLIILPFIIAGIATSHGYLSVAGMVLAWVTDLLDGRVARRMALTSPFGKALDSTIDFVFIYLLFIAFYAAGRLETWQFGFLYLAMLTILSLQLVLGGTGRAEEVATTPLGKITGALQYAYLLFLVAMEMIPWTPILVMVNTVLFIVLAAAIVLNSVQCGVIILRTRRLDSHAHPV